MATYKQMANLARKRWKQLEKKIGGAVQSISTWKDEVKQLGGLVASLEGMGGEKTGRGPRNGTKGKNRGKWKPGSRGRKPNWYKDEQKALEKAAGKQEKAGKKTVKAEVKQKSKKRKKVSAKQLAGLAKARATLAAKRKAAQKSTKPE